MGALTSSIETSPKTPPFQISDDIEFRGWRAGLETVQIRSDSPRSKIGAAGRGIPAWINQRIESLALSDYLYIVAHKASTARPVTSKPEPPFND